MSGTAKLIAYQTENKLSRGQLAQRLGLSEGFVSLLLSGKRFAGMAVALRIEKATKGTVSASSVMSPTERRTFAAARRVVRGGSRSSPGKSPDSRR